MIFFRDMAFKELPFEIVPIDKDLRDKQLQTLRYAHGAYWVGPKKYLMPAAYKEEGLKTYNFEARKDDVYVTGYGRSGTTMHCEMIWLIGNDLNYAEAREKRIDERFPHMDYSILWDIAKNLPVIDYDLENRTNQRFMKAHLPLSLLPPSIFEVGSKVIYCARNPKDCIVSAFHLFQLFNKTEDTTESFADYFRTFKYNWRIYTPFFEHMKEAWDKRNDKNFLFLFFEDTIKDKRRTILRVAEFLGKKLTDDQIDGLLDHLSIDKFRKNKSVNLDHLRKEGKLYAKEDFIRKGKSGGWRDYFVGDLEKEVEEWIAENIKDTDLRFPEI